MKNAMIIKKIIKEIDERLINRYQVLNNEIEKDSSIGKYLEHAKAEC